MLIFICEGDRALRVEMCHHSITLSIAAYLNKAIWNLRNLCEAKFFSTHICGELLCMFLLKMLKIGDPLLCI